MDRIRFVDARKDAAGEFAEAVRLGLSSARKSIPPRFFYDQRGSQLFEQITRLPEYYLTRCEREILQAHAMEFVSLEGRSVEIVEFGSGSSCKSEILLTAANQDSRAVSYVPIDISAEFLKLCASALAAAYPWLSLTAIAGEYEDALDALPDAVAPRLYLFLGSNIGNMTSEEARRFLARLAGKMGPMDRLLVGIDLIKDRDIVERAYNDSAGVTAAFNRNLLDRINRELGGHFDSSLFAHKAPYLEAEGKIEMRLVATASHSVHIDALEQEVSFQAGEFIHTEDSRKYSIEGFAASATRAGLTLERHFTDDKQWFALTLLRK